MLTYLLLLFSSCFGKNLCRILIIVFSHGILVLSLATFGIIKAESLPACDDVKVQMCGRKAYSSFSDLTIMMDDEESSKESAQENVDEVSNYVSDCVDCLNPEEGWKDHLCTSLFMAEEHLKNKFETIVSTPSECEGVRSTVGCNWFTRLAGCMDYSD